VESAPLLDQGIGLTGTATSIRAVVSIRVGKIGLTDASLAKIVDSPPGVVRHWRASMWLLHERP